MKRNTTDSGEILDRAVREIRGMSAGDEEEQAILDRVKSGLQMEGGKVVYHPSAASAARDDRGAVAQRRVSASSRRP